MTGFQERFSELLLKEKLNVSQLAKKCGYKNGQKLNRLHSRNQPEEGEHLPSFEILFDILRVLPRVSGRWLILGEGEMYKKETGDQFNAQTQTVYAGKDQDFSGSTFNTGSGSIDELNALRDQKDMYKALYESSKRENELLAKEVERLSKK